MTDTEKKTPRVVVLQDDWLDYSNEELRKKVYDRFLHLEKSNMNNNVNIEEKDIYIFKDNITQEEMEKMCLYKYIAFFVINFEIASDLEKSKIREVYEKMLETAIEGIIVCTHQCDLLTTFDFFDYMFKEKNIKNE